MKQGDRRTVKSGILQLQSGAGNRVVCGLLREAGHKISGTDRLNETVIKAVKQEPGQPLGGQIRRQMESRLDYDLGSARIHTGSRAEESARALGAKAYTLGGHIAFGRGEFNLTTDGGRALLLHELTHVVQNRGRNPSFNEPLKISEPTDPLEIEAAEFAAGTDWTSEEGTQQADGSVGPASALRRQGLEEGSEARQFPSLGLGLLMPQRAALIYRCGGEVHEGCDCADESHSTKENPTSTPFQEGQIGAVQRLTSEEREENLKSSKFSGQLRLESAFDNNPPLGIGESGEAVRLMQEALVAEGFTMPMSTKPTGEMDGVFGGETLGTVEAFQGGHGLVVDGRAGRQTLGTLDELMRGPEPSPPVPPGPLPPCPSGLETETMGVGSSLQLVESFDLANLGLDLHIPGLTCEPQNGKPPAPSCTCNPPALPACDPTREKTILGAFGRAGTFLANAKPKVEAYIKSPQDPSNKAVKDALKKHFGWEESARQNAANPLVPEHVNKAIDDLLSAITELICSACPGTPSGSDPDAKRVTASTFKAWHKTNCYNYFDPFFGKGPTEQAKIVIHEMMHSWKDASDSGGYEGDPGYPFPLVVSDKNADSYANLIRDLG